MESLRRCQSNRKRRSKSVLLKKTSSVLASVGLIAAVVTLKPQEGQYNPLLAQAEAAANQVEKILDSRLTIDSRLASPGSNWPLVSSCAGCYAAVPRGELGNIKDIYDPIGLTSTDGDGYVGYVEPKSKPGDIYIGLYKVTGFFKNYTQNNEPQFGGVYVPNKEMGGSVTTPLAEVWETEKQPGPDHKTITVYPVFLVPGEHPGNIDNLVNQPVGVSPARAEQLIAQEKAEILRSAVGYVTFYKSRSSGGGAPNG